MAKKVRLERFNVEDANVFLRGNRMNIYGQETFIELYGRNGEDFSNVWFEDLRAELVKRPADPKPVNLISGRYCTKKTVEGERKRYEIEFQSFEGEKVEVIREGEYRSRYRRVD